MMKYANLNDMMFFLPGGGNIVHGFPAFRVYQIMTK